MSRTQIKALKRGDIVYLDFSPSAGTEQAYKRPGLVLSSLPFNKQLGLALIAPITTKAKNKGFEVKLIDTQTTGVVLCDHIRTLDYKARFVTFIEAAPTTVIKEALAKARVILS